MVKNNEPMSINRFIFFVFLFIINLYMVEISYSYYVIGKLSQFDSVLSPAIILVDVFMSIITVIIINESIEYK